MSSRRLVFGAGVTALVLALFAVVLAVPARSADEATRPIGCSLDRSPDGTVATVRFNPVDGDGAVRYVVERRRSQSTWFWAGRVNAAGTSFVDRDLNRSAGYEYRVRAQSSAGTNSEPTTCGVGTGGRAPLEPGGNGVLMGVYVDTGGQSTDSVRRQEIVNFENNVAGRRLDIAQIFSPAKDQAWKVGRANWMLDRNQIPMISWKPGPRSGAVAGNGEGQKILDGVYDGDIRARAAQARQINGPFFSRLFHEMDGRFGRPYDFTPEQFGQIWRRVHRIFEEEGVTNAVWAWTPATFDRADVDVARYYPGDDYVDWIGVDPYSWIGNSEGGGPCRTDPGRYKSMNDAVGSRFWAFAAAHPDKPVILGEWGAGHREGTEVRPRFIRSVGDMLAARPQVKALVYFNHNADAHCVWRLDQGPGAGRDAYRQLVGDGRWAVDTGALIRSGG